MPTRQRKQDKLAATLSREMRRTDTVRRYLRGENFRTIATAVGSSPATVHRDIEEARAEWLTQRVDDVRRMKVEQLAKIDELEREAWAAYTASKESETTVRTENDFEAPAAGKKKRNPGAERVIKTVSGRQPDARYLDQVQWCIDARCKILGLYSPTKVAPTNVAGDESYRVAVAALSDSELALLRKIGQVRAKLAGPTANSVIDQASD